MYMRLNTSPVFLSNKENVIRVRAKNRKNHAFAVWHHHHQRQYQVFIDFVPV